MVLGFVSGFGVFDAEPLIWFGFWRCVWGVAFAYCVTLCGVCVLVWDSGCGGGFDFCW